MRIQGLAVQITSTQRRTKPSIVVVWLVMSTRNPQKSVRPQNSLPAFGPVTSDFSPVVEMRTPEGGEVTTRCTPPAVIAAALSPTSVLRGRKPTERMLG